MDRFSETLFEKTYRLAHSKGPNSKTSWICTLQKITLPLNGRSSSMLPQAPMAPSQEDTGLGGKGEEKLRVPPKRF
jgi:hypothetical protein